jgi:hypothetical protein
MRLLEPRLLRQPRSRQVAALNPAQHLKAQQLMKILKIHSLGVPLNS